jgi:hypothetical protein
MFNVTTSFRYLRTLTAVFALVVLSSAVFAADPGLPYPSDSEASDQKAGSALYYNAYTSSATGQVNANTRINITNTNPFFGTAVHLFFVDGTTCSIADSYICLTANQTASFLAGDVDPGVSGYIVAIATNEDGSPRFFNYLIGDEYVRYASGHQANLGAVAFAKLNGANVISPDGVLATLFFDGLNLTGSYNRAPRVVSLDNLPSRADGNDTLLILNRVGGNLAVGASPIGALFGILYDDAETAFSFTFSTSACQFRSSISSSFPRTAPRVDVVIPAGRSGWMKFFSQSDIGLLGAAINLNPNASSQSNAFNGGHNLHHLTLTGAETLIIPIFPANCGFITPM